LHAKPKIYTPLKGLGNLLYLCLKRSESMGQKKAKTKPSVPVQQKSAPVKKTKSELPYILALLVITFLVFSPSLKNEFVNWDDDRNVYENPLVPTLNVKAIFTQTVIGTYNPLNVLSYAIEHKMFGMNPKMMHLTNILLHLLCLFFVFKIFRALNLELRFALFGAALFAIHPLRVESVTWLTERKDVLYGAFFCSALYLYIKNLDDPKKMRSFWIFVLFFIGLFSKIQMVALPLTMLVVDYYKERKLNFKLIWEKWYYFLAAFIYGCIGIYFLSQQGALDTNEGTQTGAMRILIGSYSFITYCIKWIYPYMMSPLYPYPDKLSIWHYLSLPACLLIGFGIYIAYKRNIRPLVFGFMFFFVNIVFLLQILGAGQGYLADRFTYIAYIGLFFISSYYIQSYLNKNPNQSSAIFAILGIYLVFLSYLTFKQTTIWKNSGTLWTHVLKYYKNTALPYGNRANYYRDNKQFDLALSDYNSAIALKAGHATYNSRAKLFFNKNEDVKAIADYDKAISLHPQAEYYVNRGAAKAKLGRMNEALEDFNKGLEMDKNWKVGYLNRSIIHNQNGRFDLALADIDSYLRLDPNNGDLWYEGGRCSRALNNLNKAIEYYNKAIRLKPNVGLFYLERGRTHEMLGNKTAAEQDMQQASRLGEKIQ
jgi:tetratricopeptide (TPR) repeat protein